MCPVPDALVSALIEHGPIGILALAGCLATYKLAVKVDALQEKRVSDVEKVTIHLQAVTVALDRNTDAMERLLDHVERSR